jgi:hypothetical protein
MYAQLVQQTFRAPKVYPELPSRDHREEYAEAELGLKIACGMEMMYQQRKRDGVEGKGSTWEAFRQSLEKSGYFQGLLPGSNEYQRLMHNAQEYYRNTSLHSKSRLVNCSLALSSLMCMIYLYVDSSYLIEYNRNIRIDRYWKISLDLPLLLILNVLCFKPSLVFKLD